MMTYSEKLKDPRWQKKRLKIFERDKFTCQKCADKETTLHVHHRIYLRGKDPWDYPDNCLVTLCEPCHQIETDIASTNQKILIDELLKVGVYSSDMDYFGYIISESIKSIGYKNFEFLLYRLHTELDPTFRIKVVSDIDEEKARLKKLDSVHTDF